MGWTTCNCCGTESKPSLILSFIRKSVSVWLTNSASSKDRLLHSGESSYFLTWLSSLPTPQSSLRGEWYTRGWNNRTKLMSFWTAKLYWLKFTGRHIVVLHSSSTTLVSHSTSYISSYYLPKEIDRAALANAYVSGLKEDIGLVGNQYNILGTCLTVGCKIGWSSTSPARLT